MSLIRAIESALVRRPTTGAVSKIGGIREPVIGPEMQTRYLGLRSSLMPEWDAETAIRQAYLANVIVYRCIEIIAKTIASLPFRCGFDPTQPEEYDVNAPLAKLLGPPPGGPNPDTAPTQLWAHAIAQWIVTGRVAWEIEWSGSKVVALWPLISQYVHPIPNSSDTQSQYPTARPSWFVAYEYYTPLFTPRTLSADQVFYHWRPSQTDWHQPESPLQAARLDTSVAVMQSIYNEAFLKNDAMPAAVAVTQQFANKEQFDAFKAQFLGSFGGPKNAGKMAFVEADTEDGNVSKTFEIKTLGLSQKDAQLYEQSKQAMKNIAIALGVPFSKLDSSDRTFSNAGEEDETFELNTIIPLAKEFVEVINIRLAPLVGKEVGWFDLSSLKIMQKAREVKAFLQVSPLDAKEKGIISLNEARDILGQERLDDPKADEIEALNEPEPEPVALPDDPTGNMPDEMDPEMSAKTDMGGDKSVEKASPKPVRAEIEIDKEQIGAERRARTRAVTYPAVETLEQQFERTFKNLFARQEKAVLDRLAGKRGRQWVRKIEESPELPSIDSLFDKEFWRSETENVSTEQFNSVLTIVGLAMASKYGFKFEPLAPYVAEFVQGRANKLAGHVTDTTYRAILSEITQGIAEGDGIPEFSRRIESVFDAANSYRATTIARTEVIGSYNGASNLFALELGPDVIAGKEWIATDDARTRADHAEGDGQIKAIGDSFVIGGVAMRAPHDQGAPADQVVNCRCTLGLLTPEEYDQSRQSTSLIRIDEIEAELRALAGVL